MKQLWDKWVKRLDALQERERIAVFAGAALVVLALIYLVAIEPDLERRKLLSARIADQERQVAAAQVRKQELARTLLQDPDSAVRERIAGQRRQIAEIETQLAGLQRTLVAPDRMATVLQDLVGADQRIQLISLRNLPAAPLVGEAVQTGDKPADAAAKAATKAGDGHVYKHGVEIVVQGSYLDLLAYVARLEKQPWQVYWGKTVMSADYPKVVVSLTLYTLSLDKSWLVV
jgi:MSHA biogenesis protein MshJ